jgi:hypothetical protein
MNHLHHYESLRQRLIDLHSDALDWAMHKGPFNKAVHRLQLAAPDGTLLLEDEEDMNYLSDALLYETTVGGVRTIGAFFNANPPDNDLDKQLRAAMVKADLGLYRVESTDPQQGEMFLRALVAGVSDSNVINIGLSATAFPGLVIATRVLALPEISMCGGAYFLFNPEKEKRLIKTWWTKQGIDRFALFRKLFRQGDFLFQTI